MKLLTGVAAAATIGLPAVALTQTVPTPPPAALPEVEVVAPTPLLGSGVDRNTVPSATQVITNKDVTIQGPPDALGALENEAVGVHLDNAYGNPSQPVVFYHGFDASALQGTPQGLAVYVNGARFNDPFGDTVNWDLIPSVAIDKMNVVSANPVFGLNALGGAISVQLKNGFTYHGGEVEMYGGSFGQVAGDFQYGKQIGDTAIYVAGSGLSEQGWRDNQASGLKQLYADLGWRGQQAELHVSVDLAQTNLMGPGAVPIQLLAADPRAQFTGPDTINNNYLQINVNGNYDINDTTSVQVLAYYNNLLQRFSNGNGALFPPCNDGSGNLCQSPGVFATDRLGNPIPAFLGPDANAYGSIADQTTSTNGYGASAQVTNTDKIFGHANQFIAGFSFDGAQTLFDGNTQVGGLQLASRQYFGPGITVDLADGSIVPVRANISNAYYGLFVTDTFNITSRLAANLSGRFNSAQIGIVDQMGGALTGNHAYNIFNPSAGLTYMLTQHVTLYGSYAQSSRAPTPAELTCSDPASPCSLANFFTGDPALKMPVARTWEFGVRGQFTPYEGSRVSWVVDAYRSNLSDDIWFAQSPVFGTGYYQAVGNTQRQGIDAGLQFNSSRWQVWVNYSYTDATFQSGFIEGSPDNPAANANGNIAVMPGNVLPGIPTHLVKVGAEYKATEQWTVGAILVGASSQYLFGDEANLTPKLPGYVRLDLNTQYQVTPHIQVFALLLNALDQRYYTYGTFSPTTSVPIVQAPNASNPRSYVLAAPVGAFGGVKVTF